MRRFFSIQRQFLLFFLFLTLTAPNIHASVNDDFSAWGAIQGQGGLFKAAPSNKTLWWLEAQGRFSDDVQRLGQSIIRPGLGYQLNKNVSIWLGYGWIFNSPPGRDETNEHRIWQQLIWKDSFDFGNLLTRTRLEQRFLSNGNDAGWRFRQFVKYTHPVISERFYLSIWDEVFVNLNSTDWGANSGFGQNRFFSGIGVFIDQNRHFRFEFGYINQFIDNRGRNDQFNHILSGSLFIRY